MKATMVICAMKVQALNTVLEKVRSPVPPGCLSKARKQ